MSSTYFNNVRENKNQSNNFCCKENTKKDSTKHKACTQQGPRGFQGPYGLKGNDGDKGEDGEKGEIGLTGNTGPQGPSGAKGDKGDIGLTGATGPQGLPGPAGTSGVAGRDGIDGEVRIVPCPQCGTSDVSGIMQSQNTVVAQANYALQRTPQSLTYTRRSTNTVRSVTPQSTCQCPVVTSSGDVLSDENSDYSSDGSTLTTIPSTSFNTNNYSRLTTDVGVGDRTLSKGLNSFGYFYLLPSSSNPVSLNPGDAIPWVKSISRLINLSSTNPSDIIVNVADAKGGPGIFEVTFNVTPNFPAQFGIQFQTNTGVISRNDQNFGAGGLASGSIGTQGILETFIPVVGTMLLRIPNASILQLVVLSTYNGNNVVLSNNAGGTTSVVAAALTIKQIAYSATI